MLIDKKSLVDISYLRYKINDEVKCLDNLIYEDNANYYYLIDEFDLKANENINEYYAIWLSDEYKDVFNNNTLINPVPLDRSLTLTFVLSLESNFFILIFCIDVIKNFDQS